MTFNALPKNPITAEQAVEEVRKYIAERAGAGVQIAHAFDELELTDHVLTAAWNEDKIGAAKSQVLLRVNPYENLARFIGVPLAFDNELGRQIRQHVREVSVMGPFGVGTLSSQELYEGATGMSADE